MYQPTPIQRSEVGYLYLVDGGWEIHRWRRYNMQVFGPYKTIQQAEKAARALGFGSTKVSREEELLRELADKQERAEHRRLWGR
jgi:hypothetical protein